MSKIEVLRIKLSEQMDTQSNYRLGNIRRGIPCRVEIDISQYHEWFLRGLDKPSLVLFIKRNIDPHVWPLPAFKGPKSVCELSGDIVTVKFKDWLISDDPKYTGGEFQLKYYVFGYDSDDFVDSCDEMKIKVMGYTPIFSWVMQG